MQILALRDGIEYRRVDAQVAPSMSALLAAEFCRAEPMAVAVGFPHRQLERLVAAFMPKAVSERLSIVAHDRSTGQLVGALLADDFGTPPPAALDEAVPGFSAVGSLLDGLDEKYRAAVPVEPGTHVHIFMVGVEQAVSGRGIAASLIHACVENARDLGYRSAVTEATGAASQHVFRKLGFRDLHVASYRDFVFNGERVFSSIQGVEGAVLMELALA